MRVLFVLHSWGLIGGTERYAAGVIPALQKRGHEVTVLCAALAGENPVEVPVLVEPDLAHRRSPRAAMDAVEKRVRSVEPEVVFVSALMNTDALARLAAVAPMVRYVHDHVLFCPSHNKYREDGETCHDPMGLVCLRRYWLHEGCVGFKRDGSKNALVHPLRLVARKRREMSLTRRSARVLTNSSYMRQELLKVGFAPERTSVLRLFTLSNTEAQPAGPLPEETERFLSKNDPLLFTPARLTLPDKGVDFLLTALAKVTHPFRAVVSGTGPAEEWLRRKARDDGLAERVHFSGWLDPDAVETLYERATVVVCPSVWDEPFGLVGLESMAHGKPVVAFRVGGIPDWLADGETGLLVARKDTDGMAQAIDRLLGDRDLAHRYGERGREVVGERFTIEAHVDGLEDAFRAASNRIRTT
ncbi:MAG: glycosyltransferase family 4 protein [Planctomycetota bacterium]|nr:glycosyltransferase family 4 protein [Planctomycetota bacterium]